MSLKFTPEDFDPYRDLRVNGTCYYNTPEHSMRIAQAKFDQWLSEQETIDLTTLHGRKTYRIIEEIKPKECKHEPVHIFEAIEKSHETFYKKAECKHCGIELVARWEEKK